MKIKGMTIEKMDEAGTGRARIAQLSAVDSDGDTYAPGAFAWKAGGGQWVNMIPAHDRRAMPFGKAWLHEENDWCVADLYLNLDTQTGKDWHATLKFDLAKGTPVQEWSYGYQVLDAVQEQRDGKYVQILKKLDVDEISPVLRGAGVGTGTLSMKSAELKAASFASLIGSLTEMAVTIGDDPKTLSATGLKQLGDVHAAIGVVLRKAAGGPAEDDALVGDLALASFMHVLSRKYLTA